MPVALACYEHQTYKNRELIIVDDGSAYPVTQPEAANTRIVRVQTGMPLGVKLNCGIDAGRGSLIMKMDDDDWYAPSYLETSVSALLQSERVVCQPTVVFHMGFLFFELKTWQIHESIENNVPGATLLFSKDQWRRRPFRPVPTDEDTWFYRDQIRFGAVSLPIDSRETYVAIRHSGHEGTLGHTWRHQLDGTTLEDYLTSRPLYTKTPEELLPAWALETYRRIHGELNQAEPLAGAGNAV